MSSSKPLLERWVMSDKVMTDDVRCGIEVRLIVGCKS